MGGNSPERIALAGYLCLAFGVIDGLIALLVIATERPADPGKRKRLALMFGVSGVALVAIGAAFLLGVLAKDG